MFSAAFYRSLEEAVISAAAFALTLVGFGIFVALFGVDP